MDRNRPEGQDYEVQLLMIRKIQKPKVDIFEYYLNRNSCIVAILLEISKRWYEVFVIFIHLLKETKKNCNFSKFFTTNL